MKKIIVSTVLGLATGFSPLFAVGNAKTSPAAGVTNANSLTKKNKLLIGSIISVPILATATLVLLKLKSRSYLTPDTTLINSPTAKLLKTDSSITETIPSSGYKLDLPETLTEDYFDKFDAGENKNNTPVPFELDKSMIKESEKFEDKDENEIGSILDILK